MVGEGFPLIVGLEIGVTIHKGHKHEVYIYLRISSLRNRMKKVSRKTNTLNRSNSAYQHLPSTSNDTS